MRVTVYGFGGYDESKPNNNIVSIEELDDVTGELLAEEEFVESEVENASRWRRFLNWFGLGEQ